MTFDKEGIERLRTDLITFYSQFKEPWNKIAGYKLKQATNEELVIIAKREGFDLAQYARQEA